ncbi:hypothetical protein D8Y20_13225 [Mariprofundus sp. EBB-1]|uniref:sulfotransferase family 2 domain-containing protein n=1 Tax=Mariprofundus sp. EBB-1 TaxID=2650971 RepID=UPI000EF22874|nr:sulfotransferase family 2 domain-containing protein [Mariprofundus sp. EBB-1]RLL49162.1 hypothetical protein D8Y20_13225 [Mariprofundus sp. EBB-1]
MWPFQKKEPERELVPALFMHIQKTAGTSIVEIAKQHYGDKNIVSHGDYSGRKPECLSGKLFISGHFGYEYAESLLSSRYSFTFLRDPVERVLSFYYFCRTKKTNEHPIYQVAQSSSLEVFLRAGIREPSVRAYILNNQVWQLAHGFGGENSIAFRKFFFRPEELLDLAKMHLNNFSHIGFTETFEKDEKIVLSALRIPESEGGMRINVTKNRPSIADLSITESKLLEELTLWDQLLYQYAWSRRIQL